MRIDFRPGLGTTLTCTADEALDLARQLIEVAQRTNKFTLSSSARMAAIHGTQNKERGAHDYAGVLDLNIVLNQKAAS
jgi:hypothetical protein